MEEHLRETQAVGEASVERLPPPEALPPLNRRGIATAGLSWARPGFAFTRLAPWHDTLLMTTGGVGEVWTGGAFVRCEVGSAYWAPRGKTHAYRCPEGSAWDLTWVTTSPDARPLRPHRATVEPELGSVDAADATTYVAQFCREAARDPGAPALELLAELLALSLARVTATPLRLERVWASVDERLHVPWTLASLAAEAGLSPEQLRAVCVRENGESPMRHLTTRRMMRAATLLVGTSDTVERISRRVGYANPFSFSTAFRRWAGVAPTDYRSASRSAAEMGD